MKKIFIRKPKLNDTEEIKKIIDLYSEEGSMLGRSIYEIYNSIRDFFVAEINGKIIGCVALHIFGKEYKPGLKELMLAEIRSLAVLKDYQNQGIGTRLIKTCILDAKNMGVTRIFVLTIQENLKFFKKLKFRKIPKKELSQKIWQECVKCPRFPFQCNEIPLFLNI